MKEILFFEFMHKIHAKNSCKKFTQKGHGKGSRKNSRDKFMQKIHVKRFMQKFHVKSSCKKII